MIDKNIELEIAPFIPRDKGWMIRMGYLDVTKGYGSKDITDFFSGRSDLSGDEKAAEKVFSAWEKNEPLDAVESRTMYILAQFYLWKNNIKREILKGGTLTKRIEESDATPDVVNWPLAKLLTLEDGTTQWATAAILLGNTETLPEVSFYLKKTYDSLKHWNEQRAAGKLWVPQTDPTLTVQAREYLTLLRTGRKISVVPTKLDDCDLYCFLNAFGCITREYGESIWPQLKKHESNRFKEMEETMEQLRSGIQIETKDHRVIHAEAMWIQYQNPGISIEDMRARFVYPDYVSKAWPQCWEFLKYCAK